MAIVVVIPVAVYVISTRVEKTYEASATIKVQPTNVNLSGYAPQPITDPATEALFLVTPRASAIAAKRLDLPQAEGASVGSRIAVAPLTSSSGTSTQVYVITAQDSSAAGAARLANAYARAVDAVLTGKTLNGLHRTMSRLQAQSDATDDPTTRTTLAQQIQQLRGAAASQSDAVQTVQTAVPPASPVSPHPKRNTGLAALVALLLGLGVVAIVERFDRRVRNSGELEQLLGAPLLSVVPGAAFPGARPAPGAVREAFRTLASSLVYFNADRSLTTVLVASPTRGDGKTTVAAYLGVALARDGQNVVLVDCDLRHPQVAVRLGVEPRAGLSEVLAAQVALRAALVDVDVGDGRLRVLAAGTPPPNPTRLLSSERMDSVLAELAELADIMVVDTPALLNVSDAIPLVERVSGTVAVAKIDQTHRDALVRLRQVIDTAHGTLLGTVATGGSSAGLYGYGRFDYDYDADTTAPHQTVAETMPEPETVPAPEPPESELPEGESEEEEAPDAEAAEVSEAEASERQPAAAGELSEEEVSKRQPTGRDELSEERIPSGTPFGAHDRPPAKGPEREPSSGDGLSTREVRANVPFAARDRTWEERWEERRRGDPSRAGALFEDDEWAEDGEPSFGTSREPAHTPEADTRPPQGPQEDEDKPARGRRRRFWGL